MIKSRRSPYRTTYRFAHGHDYLMLSRTLLCASFQERKNNIWECVGLGEHRYTCLLKNLITSKRSGFYGEVGISNTRTSGTYII